MNPYREDGACQECLKRKVKSPMSGNALQLAHSMLMLCVVSLLVGADVYCIEHMLWYGVGVTSVLTFGTFISAMNYISGRKYQ
jgi:hypothetical protein